jgi:hypothetical protein
LKGTRGIDEPELVRVAEDSAVVVSRSGFLPEGWRVAAYANVATAN